jgi:putative FmdB family regulatory protein
MPTYEYACDACRHEFEEFQSITAERLTRCPKCGRKKLRRLLGTGGGIIFKGSGFYQTDYRSESYKTAAESEKKATGGEAPSTNADTSAKPTEPAKPAAPSENIAAKKSTPKPAKPAKK